MKLGIRCVHAACYYKGRTTRWSAGSRRDVESPSADNQTAGGVRAAVVNFNVFTFYIRIQPQQIMWNMFIVYDAAGTCGVFFLSAAQSRRFKSAEAAFVQFCVPNWYGEETTPFQLKPALYRPAFWESTKYYMDFGDLT